MNVIRNHPICQKCKGPKRDDIFVDCFNLKECLERQLATAQSEIDERSAQLAVAADLAIALRVYLDLGTFDASQAMRKALDAYEALLTQRP